MIPSSMEALITADTAITHIVNVRSSLKSLRVAYKVSRISSDEREPPPHMRSGLSLKKVRSYFGIRIFVNQANSQHPTILGEWIPLVAFRESTTSCDLCTISSKS